MSADHSVLNSGGPLGSALPIEVIALPSLIKFCQPDVPSGYVEQLLPNPRIGSPVGGITRFLCPQPVVGSVEVRLR